MIKNDTIRTFIALKILPSEKMLRVIKYCKSRLINENIKWVNQENLHLTLKFLGDTKVEQAKQITEELSVLSLFPGFSFSISGTGFFDRNKNPFVLFLNIPDSAEMIKLFYLIEEKLYVSGFQKEKRNFKPHLTIARIKSLENKHTFFETVKLFKNEFIQQAEANEITLYQSILENNGPKYFPVYTVKLNNSGEHKS